MDSEEEERRHQQRRRGGSRRPASPARSDRRGPARISNRTYRSSTDRDIDEEPRRHGERVKDHGRKESRNHEESYYDRREREKRDEEERLRRREEERRRSRWTRDDDERSSRGGRYIKEEYPDDDRGSFYGHHNSRPPSRTGSTSHNMSSMSSHNMSGDMYARMIAEQTAAYQKQMWLSQLQVTNPQAYQMEVQRQQLQAAVDQMEAALKDPVQGPDNVAIYKQYWDQYSGSLQALSKENPLMHHLLQHFRNNWWHLVPVKEEPVEERPVSTAPRFYP